MNDVSLTGNVETARRVMVLFFLVDASGSMAGTKMGTVNDTIKNVIPEIRKVSLENADAQIKIAVLEFSSGTRWLTKNGPEEAEKFVWQSINANGMTDMGEACRQLAKKLSTKEGGFMREATGSYAPAIFLISDGEPNDDFDSGLAELLQVNWFKVSVKVAVAIGDDANTEVLARFVGHKEAVVKTHDPVALAQMIKFATVTASKVASKSSNAVSSGNNAPPPDNSKQEEFNKSIKTQVAAMGGTQNADGTLTIPPSDGSPEVW
jgi:uncharacterized protein YegL